MHVSSRMAGRLDVGGAWGGVSRPLSEPLREQTCTHGAFKLGPSKVAGGRGWGRAQRWAARVEVWWLRFQDLDAQS